MPQSTTDTVIMDDKSAMEPQARQVSAASGAVGWYARVDRPWRRVALIGAVALVAIYFWQIFVTMPHLVYWTGDEGSYLANLPRRGPAVYYLTQLALAVWNDFYVIGVIQGVFLAVSASLLAYAVAKATRSPLLGLLTLVVCLFKVSLVEQTQELASDSLWSSACIGVTGAALLLYERVTLARIALFLLVALLAVWFRSIGNAVLWALVLVLTLRLWPRRRRALGVIAAGAVGVYAFTATMSYINYRTWTPQSFAGFVMIFGASFIADENIPASTGYPHEFAVETLPMRKEYEAAPTWAKKFEILNKYVGTPIWKIADDTLMTKDSDKRLDPNLWDVTSNNAYKRAALTIMWHNPIGYAKMTLIKLLGGIEMFTSWDNYPLGSSFRNGHPAARIAVLNDYIRTAASHYLMKTRVRHDLMPTVRKLLHDWETYPLKIRYDIAEPLRAFYDLEDNVSISLTQSPLQGSIFRGGTLDWAFVAESAIVSLLALAQLLRRRRIGNIAGVLLMLIAPTWAYLVAICLVHCPNGIYMDATSPFVYLALLIGFWGMITAAGSLLWVAAKRASLGWSS